PTPYVVNATSITWRWLDNAVNETGYSIYGGTSPASAIFLSSNLPVAATSGTVLSTTGIGLLPNTTYFRYLGAVNGGSIALSSGVFVKTHNNLSAVISTPVYPADQSLVNAAPNF